MMKKRMSMVRYKTWRLKPLEATKEEVLELDCAAREKATLASISGVPKFNTFRMRGVLQG
jgi:hypothetical protein